MTKEQLIQKLTSRKFWLTLAAFLGSIAASVAGFATDNGAVAAVGIVCGVLSTAIYAAAEAYVDASAQKSNVTTTMKQVSASSTDKTLVQSVMKEG